MKNFTNEKVIGIFWFSLTPFSPYTSRTPIFKEILLAAILEFWRPSWILLIPIHQQSLVHSNFQF